MWLSWYRIPPNLVYIYTQNNFGLGREKVKSMYISGQTFQYDQYEYCLVMSYSFCDPMDYSPPDSFVDEISQTRILEGVVISFSRESSLPRDQICISCSDR